MADEKNGVTKSSSTTEMSPQEDGTKVPLTADSPGAAVEVKFTSETSPNGDAKIDVGNVPTFSGLNKEELMKFSTDPFWVKLRWVLFITFWLAWLLMLIAAIIIIVFAPRCVPPPELLWVQESPMLDYTNMPADETAEQFAELMDNLKLTSVYIPDIISATDFDAYAAGREEEVAALIKAFGEKSSKKIVTDFIGDTIDQNHVWKQNDSYSDFYGGEDGHTIQYNHTGVIPELKDVFGHWVDRGVAGFLMDVADTEDKVKARDSIQEYLDTEKGGAVVSGIVDMSEDLPAFAEPGKFKEFLASYVANVSDWNYFKYNPDNAVGQISLSDNHVPLITMALFLVPGTPIMSINRNHADVNKTIELVNGLADLREDDSIKFGNITYFNSTDRTVAYTRIQKGVPGYAVAINLESEEQTIDFSSHENVDDKGKLKFRFVDGAPSKVDEDELLNNIHLNAFEGKIIQFVPKY